MPRVRQDIFGGRVKPSDRKRIKAFMRQAPREMHREYERMFQTWGEEWHRLMTRQFRPAGSNSSRLSNRTGALRRSLDHVVKGATLKTLRLRAFSAAVPYARAQEYGGVIKSSRPGGYLTIPLDRLKTEAGVTREISARDMIRREGLVGKKKGGRLTFWRNDEGTLFLGRVRKDGSRLPLWVLKRQIVLPGPKSPKGGRSRLGFHRNWERLAGRRTGQLERATHRAMVRARGGQS